MINNADPIPVEEIVHYEVTGNTAYKPVLHEMTCTTYEKRPMPSDMRVPAEEVCIDCTDDDKKFRMKMSDFLLSDKVIRFYFTVESHQAMLEAIELFKDMNFEVRAEPRCGYYEIEVEEPVFWEDDDE